MKTTKAFLIVVSFLCMCSCKSESAKLQKLEGHWLLRDAEDNETNVKDRMVGIFFEYDKNGTFTTNFNPAGDTTTGTYTLSSDKIILHNPDPLTFSIEELQDSSLETSTTLRGHDFKLWLQKQ